MQTVNNCRCGAEVQPNANYCWLCGEKIQSQKPTNKVDLEPVVATLMTPRAEQLVTRAEQPVADGSAVSAIFILFSMLIVIVGVFLYSKGLALVLAFIFLPIILGTTIRMKSRPSPSKAELSESDHQTTTSVTSTAGAVATGIGAVLLSAILVIAAVALTALATVGAIVIFLLSLCSAMLSPN